MNNAFHFSSLVWDEIIAIYLFLLGIAAGASLLAVLYKQRLASQSDLDYPLTQSRLIQATALISPLCLMLGLLILIFHLTKPWAFWYLMFNYQPHSIMSMGVMLFQVYMLILLIWLASIFHQLIEHFLARYLPGLMWIYTLILRLKKLEKTWDRVLILLSVLLGAYTGFLLSALISYPMLNNPVLPMLFLVSGLSSGVATLIIALLVTQPNKLTHNALHFLHRIEPAVVSIEVLLLVAFFVGLYLGGGQKMVSVQTALGGGFWTYVFWLGVIGIGIILPQLFRLFTPTKWHYHKKAMIAAACFSLIGVLCLRFFILYTGQMTLA